MAGRTRNKKETFIDKAFREFKENVVRGFTLANKVGGNVFSFFFERLLGSSLFTMGSILDWEVFLSSLKEPDIPKKQILDLLDEKTKRIIDSWNPGEDINRELKELIVSGLNQVLEKEEFYNGNTFSSLELNKEGKELLQRGLKDLKSWEIIRFNRFVFESIYPRLIAKRSQNRLNIVLYVILAISVIGGIRGGILGIVRELERGTNCFLAVFSCILLLLILIPIGILLLIIGTAIIIIGAAIISWLVVFLLSLIYSLIRLVIQIIIAPLKLLPLIPLSIFVLFTHLIHTQKKIYHTCPYCSYRGLPSYECPECGEFNKNIQPNIYYGLLHHDCTGCGKSLPTLNVLGRNKMKQRCAKCGKLILEKHGVPLPERYVAIVGGHRSGKTSYLIMAVDEITNVNKEEKMKIKGEIEIETQKDKLGQKLKKLSRGIPLDKDEEITEPFLLYAEVNARKCLIYLYDTPGGKFETFSSMSEKHYFTLLGGLILLVDPLSFKSVRAGFNGLDYQPTPLQDVVNSILHAASSGIPLKKSGKFKMHVAVVISKADMECVSEIIGDKLTETACREAIMEWGGESAIRSIELRFENVEYFACSPLGREHDPQNHEPFRGYGIIEPLDWVLSDGKK
ncbi:MAG: hypothetical protein K8T10_21930 [Candidatus Eremiobacteraeota bacterium]|nr:hypothetical protein [Candidatus Eremiobacteraeota bacterium]